MLYKDLFLVSKGDVFVLHQLFLHQMILLLLLVIVKHIPIFNIFIPIFLHCVIQTLDEVASSERINTKLITEVIIPRQENEGKFWFIISRTLKTPVTGTNIDSTA